MENIKVNNTSATIYYNNNTVHTAYTATTTSTSDELRFLKELTNVDSPYLLLANKVNVGNGDKTVQWYVNKGNPAYLVNDAGVDKFSEISTKEAMGRLMSNYYACTADVTVIYNGTTYDLHKNNVYKISYQLQSTAGDGIFVFDVVGTFDQSVTEIPDGNSIDWTGATELSANYVETVSTPTVEEPVYTGITVNNLKNVGQYTLIASDTSLWRGVTIRFGNTDSATIRELYSVTKSVTLESVYRFYPNGTRRIVKRYLKNDSVVEAEYNEGDYFEYRVTESRTYTLYFARTSLWNTNLTQIFTATVDNVNTSRYNSFTYNNTTYTYRQNGHVYYTSSATATMGNNTIAATTTDSAYSQMVNYLSTLSPTSTEYIDNIVNNSSAVERYVFTYTNPIAASSDITNAIDKATAAMDVNNRVLYKYTGATVTDNYYENGNPVSKEYTRNQGYRLTFAASGGTMLGGYSLTKYTLQETADAVNMQAILTEANLHVNDALFGNYYGNYYCYNGDTRTIDGVTYTNGYVYRLMLNSDRTSFYFEYGKSLGVKETFTICETADDFMDALVNALNGSVDCLQEGAIVYYKGDQSTYYAKGLFELTRNEQTLTYYFKSMGGLGNQTLVNGTFLLNSIVGQNLSVSGISKFTNIRYVGSTTTSYYSGTGGSEQVEVVARIVEGDTVYERYFLVTVSA